MNNKCYSDDEEIYCEDLHEVISNVVSNLEDDFEGETEIEIFEADKTNHTISDFLPPFLSQDISERAYGVAGEWGADWGDSLKGKEVQEIVSAALENWANLTNNQPNFWSVKNVRPISVKIRVDKDGNWDTVES